MPTSVPMMRPSDAPPTDTGAVVIGRNEGATLAGCLQSVIGQVTMLVYVDSGSSDDSVAIARTMGIDVVELDRTKPFSAARARNVGLRRLRESAAIEFVQFVDGDCELEPTWIAAGLAVLRNHEAVAIVCGRLREREPTSSIYNHLCAIEWDAPVGDVESCGGIFLARVAAVLACEGFREDMIAGEEPELCFRLRHLGWKIIRLEHAMAVHDAAMTRFSQWWRRCVRSGYGYAEGHHGLRKLSDKRFWARETRSILFWGALLPLVALGGLWPSSWWSGLLLATYPVQAVRVFRTMRRRGFVASSSSLYASFCIVSKLPQALGLLSYHLRNVRRHA